MQIEQHGVVFMRLTPKTDAVAQSMASRHHLSAEAAVAAAEFAAADAATYHAALHHHEREPAAGPEAAPEPKPETIAEPADGTTLAAVDGAAELSAEAGWPMRGYDSTHSGRAPFRGPSSCPTVKWTQALGQGKRHEHNRREENASGLYRGTLLTMFNAILKQSINTRAWLENNGS